MNAAQIRSLPVQAGLTGGLFFGCVVLASLIVSQRSRFESFLKENYALPKKELSAATRSVSESLLRGEAALDEWKKVPDPERRSVYQSLMLHDDFPSRRYVTACFNTDADFFVTCAERTVVCGDQAQRLRGLRFLEMSGGERCSSVLDRLAAWADRSKRLEAAAAIGEVRQRMRATEKL